MTSVPKPLKYLRPHFATLKEIYVEWGDGENKVHCNCDLYFLNLGNGQEWDSYVRWELPSLPYPTT